MAGVSARFVQETLQAAAVAYAGEGVLFGGADGGSRLFLELAALPFQGGSLPDLLCDLNCLTLVDGPYQPLHLQGVSGNPCEVAGRSFGGQPLLQGKQELVVVAAGLG